MPTEVESPICATEVHDVDLDRLGALVRVEGLLQAALFDFGEDGMLAGDGNFDQAGAERILEAVAQLAGQLVLEDGGQQAVLGDAQDDRQLVGLLALGVEGEGG